MFNDLRVDQLCDSLGAEEVQPRLLDLLLGVVMQQLNCFDCPQVSLEYLDQDRSVLEVCRGKKLGVLGIADGDLKALKSYQVAPVWRRLQTPILSFNDKSIGFCQDLLHQVISSVKIVNDKNCAFHLANANQTRHLLLQHHLLQSRHNLQLEQRQNVWKILKDTGLAQTQVD